MAQDYSVEQLNYGRKVYDFMRWDNVAFGISIVLLIASFVIISIKGFNWGLDFTGGTVIEINLSQPADLDKIRDSLSNSAHKDPLIQNFGSSRDIMIRIPPIEGAAGQEVGKEIITIINQSVDDKATVKRIEFVGTECRGTELAQTGALALLTALICILVYVGFRFEWRLAAGAVLSLAHDVVITLGILSLFHIEIDMTIVASLMSVIGYSLNDSIVVSDRIRENFRKIRRGTPYEIMNVSLTQTLSRTIMTSMHNVVSGSDAVSVRWHYAGRLLIGYVNRCNHRYYFIYLCGFCISTEDGNETRALDAGESRKRRCRPRVITALI